MSKLSLRNQQFALALLGFLGIVALLFGSSAYADGSDNLGGIADNTKKSLKNIALLLTAIAYAMGIGLGLMAISKFKMHSANPTQVPMSAPVSLIILAGLALFLPSVFGVSGKTIFADKGVVGGIEGKVNIPGFDNGGGPK